MRKQWPTTTSSFRVRGPSFLSFHLCFSFLSGCGDPQFFQFFQGAGILISFISFISFRVWGPSFLSFLLCFSFLSGGGGAHFFHFFCVLHFFQGAGILNSFILFVFFISFGVWVCNSFISYRVLISFIFI